MFTKYSFSYFNPHSHEGSDADLRLVLHQYRYFNPHSHEGSDFSLQFHVPVLLYFNPHSHEGSDPSAKQSSNRRIISIHTPTRGATKGRLFLYNRLKISIHTPTRGATFFPTSISLKYCDFNPHSHEGSDFEVPTPCSTAIDFNPHSHEGSDTVKGTYAII